MKQLTINEINEVSGGPLPGWAVAVGVWIADYVGGHAVDRAFAAFNNWAIANSSPSWSYAECEAYMASLPNGSIE